MKNFWKVFLEADGVGGGGAADGGNPADNGGGNPAASGNPAGDADGGGGEKHNIFDSVETHDDQEAAADNKVPEEYEFKLGEGLSISDAMKERFSKVAKEANMTQAQANALMDMHSETMLEVLQAGEKQAADWEAECKAQGMLTKEKLGYAVEALNVFGGDEAKKVLIETGAANHPAVMRMLQTIGELIHEDSNHEGENKTQTKDDIGAILFANSKY